MMLHEPEISDYVKLAVCVVGLGIVQAVWPYIFPPEGGRSSPRPPAAPEGASDDDAHRHGRRSDDTGSGDG